MSAKAAGFVPPSLHRARLVTALHRAWFNPVFLGLETVGLERPALWVGNHTVMGVMDIPLLCERLLQEGVVLRSLGDRGHFKVPLWRTALSRGGMVLGSPENCAALMQSGQHVLVFPGGAREVWRRRGEAYQLIWKRRTGFVRMAIEHGYDIIPFGSLGPDEALDIVTDANDVMGTRVWQWLKRRLPLDEMTRGGEGIPPLVRGLGPTPFPRPERVYFGIGDRIPTAHLQGQTDDADVLWAVREQVAQSIRDQLSRLQEFRKTDKPANWSRLRRWLATSGEGSE